MDYEGSLPIPPSRLSPYELGDKLRYLYSCVSPFPEVHFWWWIDGLFPNFPPSLFFLWNTRGINNHNCMHALTQGITAYINSCKDITIFSPTCICWGLGGGGGGGGGGGCPNCNLHVLCIDNVTRYKGSFLIYFNLVIWKKEKENP